MTLRTRLFAVTYDRQMARTETAGLRAFREACSPGRPAMCWRSAPGPGATCPSMARGHLTHDDRAPDAAPPAARG
jgi:hypothetical protein